MKNITISLSGLFAFTLIRKKIMRLIVLFLFFGLSHATLNAQSTITSTATGGVWNNVATWIGGTIPTINDDVIITSVVYAYQGVSCNNLTVNTGAFLYNQYGGWATIAGNVINNGSVLNNPAGSDLTLNIQGNIENNGAWHISSTVLSGLSDQIITEAPGMKFEGPISMSDSLGDIILGSDVLIYGNTWNLNKSTFRTNGYRLLANSSTLQGGYIESNDTLVLNNSYIYGMQFSGNYKLDGNVYLKENGVYPENVFYGTLTVLDTLANQYGSTIRINGDIVNKGSVIYTGYEFTLNIAGNVINEGIWRPRVTNFVGTTDQTIQQTPGKSFKSIINTTDTIGDIILESDVMFEPSFDFQAGKTWSMNNAKLRTNGHKLMSENYIFHDGRIISDDTLDLNNSYILNMKFFGNYKLDGNVFSQSSTSLPIHNVFNDTLTVLDTLTGEYNSTILSNGYLVNKGAIINSFTTGYPLVLNIAGNIRNEGIWSPKETNFVSTTNQTIQQAPGKNFKSLINTTDSIGDIILESDVMLEPYLVLQGGKTWNMNKANLRTNGYKLMSENYILTNGKIISNDTLWLNNSYVDNMQFFGNYKLDGNVFSLDNALAFNNVFNDTLTVLDTLVNQYISAILVNGDLINKGSIINNWSTGYGLDVHIKGNLTNYHVFNNSNIYITGTNPRTINGTGIQAPVFFDDSVHLIGSNTIRSISFTANSKAWCYVDSSANLSTQLISNPSRITNYGRVSCMKSINNTVSNTLAFYESSINCSPGVLMNELAIDHYGYQHHPTATGTVNCWWRLRNSPQNFNDSLAWLKLNYKSNALNGSQEDSLKVFFSPNAGITWNKINTGVSIDTATNTVTIANTPSYGHYLLSSTPIGITAFHPMIESIEPTFGGNKGYVTLSILGAGLKNTSVVKLRLTGQVDIVADTSYLTDPFGESLLAMFNLRDKSPGVYDIIVETPGDSTLVKPAYFSIIPGQRSDPWVTISGRDKFPLNRWATFNLNYGNSANSDAVGTMLFYIVNDLPGLEVTFPDINFVLPQAVIDLGPDYTKVQDSLDIYYVTDSLTGYEGTNMRVYPIYIPYIPAGSSQDVRIMIKLNGSGSLKMSAWIIDPLWEEIDYNAKATEPMPNEVRLCITFAATKMFADGLIGLIPGVGCYGLLYKFVDPVAKITPVSEKPMKTMGSLLWEYASWGSSIVKCATSSMPFVSLGAKVGIGIVNMMINGGKGWDVNEGCWRKFRAKSKSNKNSYGVTSFDPNEIAGPQGFTTDNYISKKGYISYRIYFENKDTASSSALEVFIQDTLDITKFDVSTFSFNSITFGDTIIQVPGYAKGFSLFVDMHPTKDIIVLVHGAMDTTSGAISWDFHSLDRITLELIEDPDMGFLPPNINYPEGEGSVAYSCRLKETIAHNDTILNRASIIFDYNAPMITNTYANKIDTMVPISSVDFLNATQSDSVFTVSWSGNDQGCGIMYYNVFVSENDSNYVMWKAATNHTSDIFSGHVGNIYKFFCIASDSLGLTEAQKLTPEAVTAIITNNKNEEKPVPQVQLYPNPAADNITLTVINLNNEDINLSIYNALGVKVRSEMLKRQKQQQINTGELKNGIYIVTVKIKDLTQNMKLVIQR